MIIGAGPYGLSLGACLTKLGIDNRIFGDPMGAWRDTMPQGMKLKSEGFASNLYDLDRMLPLGRYCADRGIAYADMGIPVDLNTFIDYGQEFQRRLVPHLETQKVTSVRRAANGFEISLESGETLAAPIVVVATGIAQFAHVPEIMSHLPQEMLHHSSQCADLTPFAGKEVAVVGAGASALDIAALLRRQGSRVTLIARSSAIHFHTPPSEERKGLFRGIRAPMTTIGSGWKSVFCTEAPLLFHQLPESIRVSFSPRHPTPAAGWFVRDDFDDEVRVLLNSSVTKVHAANGRVNLTISQKDGGAVEVSADHLIAGTGYYVDVDRMDIL